MAAVYGGELVGIEGTYDDVNRFCSELIGDPVGEGWGFVNVNLRPYYGEGSKTLAYEICEQLGWRLPDQIVIPIASGSQLTKIDKGLKELIAIGLVEDKPYKIFGAQAEGCSPVSAAFKAGHDVVRPQKPQTIAKSLAIGNPADGPYVLDIARRTGGAVEDVNDEQIVDAIKLLARTEGIFAETAGGVTVGVTKKLIEDGLLDPSLTTVVLNTGDGLKTLDAVAPTTVPPPSSAPPLSRSERLVSHERQRPNPDHPAHVHRRSGRGHRRGRDPRRGPGGSGGERPGHRGPRPGRHRQAPPLRQRLRQRRRRPLRATAWPRRPRTVPGSRSSRRSRAAADIASTLLTLWHRPISGDTGRGDSE
ncbi:hypothetical protein SANTM175S_01524 [Streptomyces antimycoticus]